MGFPCNMKHIYIYILKRCCIETWLVISVDFNTFQGKGENGFAFQTDTVKHKIVNLPLTVSPEVKPFV